MTLLAPQIASSIENARLYEELAQREQRMEQDLQGCAPRAIDSAAARAPEMEGLDIAIGWRPAREISGDLYDFFEQSEDTFVIAFGDSSGKGRSGGVLWLAGQRAAEIAGAAKRTSVGADEAAERDPARAQSGRAVRHVDADVLEHANSRS